MNTVRHIRPKHRRHTNSELPSILYRFHGLAIPALSWATLSRNMNIPLELNQVRVIPIAIANTAKITMAMNHPGLSISHPHALFGNSMNSRKLPSSPQFEDPDPLFPSINPARKAVNPTTNHLVKSKGLKRAVFIRFHPRLKGSKYSMFI